MTKKRTLRIYPRSLTVFIVYLRKEGLWILVSMHFECINLINRISVIIAPVTGSHCPSHRESLPQSQGVIDPVSHRESLPQSQGVIAPVSHRESLPQSVTGSHCPSHRESLPQSVTGSHCRRWTLFTSE